MDDRITIYVLCFIVFSLLIVQLYYLLKSYNNVNRKIQNIRNSNEKLISESVFLEESIESFKQIQISLENKILNLDTVLSAHTQEIKQYSTKELNNQLILKQAKLEKHLIRHNQSEQQNWLQRINGIINASANEISAATSSMTNIKHQILNQIQQLNFNTDVTQSIFGVKNEHILKSPLPGASLNILQNILKSVDVKYACISDSVIEVIFANSKKIQVITGTSIEECNDILEKFKPSVSNEIIVFYSDSNITQNHAWPTTFRDMLSKGLVLLPVNIFSVFILTYSALAKRQAFANNLCKIKTTLSHLQDNLKELEPIVTQIKSHVFDSNSILSGFSLEGIEAKSSELEQVTFDSNHKKYSIPSSL